MSIVSETFLGHLRSEVWMNISGALALQRNAPTLYRDLLAMDHNREISKKKVYM